MFAIILKELHGIDEILGMMLVGYYFSYTDRPVDTDHLVFDVEKQAGITVTSGAMDEFQEVLTSMGYQFYSPWIDHSGEFIIEPGKDYDAECKRIDDEIRALVDSDETTT